MTWKPRFYQEEATDAFFKSIKVPKTNPLIGMPTGSGKSGVIGMIANKVIVHPNARIMVGTSAKELVNQDAKTMLRINPEAPMGICCSGLDADELGAPITFGSIQTLVKRLKLIKRQNIFLVDEVQMVAPGEETYYRKLIAHLRELNPNLVIGGLSATLFRSKGGTLLDNGLFTKICYDITTTKAFNALVRMGFLLPLRSHETEFKYSVEGLSAVAGDYNQKERQERVNDPDKLAIAVLEALDRGRPYNHTMWFCDGIEHVENVCAMLNELGESAVAVHSKMSQGERDRNIEAYQLGYVRHIINDGILVVGFDAPHTDHLVILRLTKAVVRHVQLLGRGTRPVYADGFDLDTIEGRLAAIEASGKLYCYVSDFGGNLDRLGPINDPKIPKKGKATGDMPIKICTTDKLVSGEGCGCYNFTAARVCEDCGGIFIWDDAPKIDKKASRAAATKLDEEAMVWAPVDNVEYVEFKRIGEPLAMKVHYCCGPYNRYTEIVAIESEKPFARKRARDWWRERFVDEPPTNTLDGIKITDYLTKPKWVLVQLNLDFPRVVQISFDEAKPELRKYDNTGKRIQ